jgi:hypothetical protein
MIRVLRLVLPEFQLLQLIFGGFIDLLRERAPQRTEPRPTEAASPQPNMSPSEDVSFASRKHSRPLDV